MPRLVGRAISPAEGGQDHAERDGVVVVGWVLDGRSQGASCWLDGRSADGTVPHAANHKSGGTKPFGICGQEDSFRTSHPRTFAVSRLRFLGRATQVPADREDSGGQRTGP